MVFDTEEEDGNVRDGVSGRVRTIAEGSSTFP